VLYIVSRQILLQYEAQDFPISRQKIFKFRKYLNSKDEVE